MKRKVKTDFSRFKDAELDQKAQEIITAMTGNANFPTPAPTLVVVQDKLDVYTTALVAAANGGTILVEVKNLKREGLEVVLAKLGLYVQLTADEDVEKMMSSGFEITKIKEPAGELVAENFKAKAMQAGTIKASVKKVKGADMYQWEYKEAGSTGAWIILTSTKAKIIITGLTGGKEYVFRMVPIGSDPSRIYSEELRSYVL